MLIGLSDFLWSLFFSPQICLTDKHRQPQPNEGQNDTAEVNGNSAAQNSQKVDQGKKVQQSESDDNEELMDQIEQTDKEDNQDKEGQKIWTQKGGDEKLDQFQITNNIKILLNRLMDQIDRKYDDFSHLIKEIDPHFKVGRKISENTARCTLLDTGVVQLDSIEVARVLVKWLQNLEDIISKPEELLNQNFELKVAKTVQFNRYSTVEQMNFSKDKGDEETKKYARCLQKEWQDLLNYNRFADGLKQTYVDLLKHQNQKKYQEYLNQFSTFILKNLQQTILEQREISIQQMEIVKFSNQISNVISWIVEQKLIETIKVLTKYCEYNNLRKGIPNLVKFKVNDLMRCQISGNQKKITQIYKQILKKQAIKQIQIVKIKNRFHTDNHDAMIFFKMKDSFLICQCQLALADEQSNNDSRLQNISTLNHFLYELERSPFGVFGQLALFLKTQSKTVSSYYNSLKLKPTPNRLEEITQSYSMYLKNAQQNKGNDQQDKSRQKELENLRHLLLQSLKARQNRPYVCSICLKYINKSSNSSNQMYKCKQTVSNICDMCCSSINQKNKPTNNMSSNQDKNATIKKQRQALYESLKTHIERKYEDRPNLPKIQDIFQLISEDLIKSNAQKEKQNLKAAIKKQQDNQGQIQNGNEDANDLQKQKALQSTQKTKITKLKAQQIMNYFEKTQPEAIKQRWKLYFAIFSKVGSLEKFILYRYNAFDSVIQNVYSPIQKYLKHEYIKLNDTSKIFTLKNLMKTDVSQVNSSDQKRILHIKDILKSCNSNAKLFDYQNQEMSMQKVKPQQNQFYFIKISAKNVKNLYFFVDRQIQKGLKSQLLLIPQIQKLPKINNLKKKIDLSGLAAIDNELQSLKNLLDKKQNIQPEINYQIEQKKNEKPTKIEQNLYLWIKDIKILDLSNNRIGNISIISEICPNLTFLDISDNRVYILAFTSEFKFLKELKAEGNKISEINDFSKFKNLNILNLSQNTIQKFKVDKNAFKLKQLYLSDNKIEKIQRARRLQSLQIFNLKNNSIAKLDFAKFPKTIRILNLKKNQLTLVQNIHELTSLENVTFEENKLQKLEFKFLMYYLKIIRLSKNPLKKLSFFSTQYIEELYLDQMKLIDQSLVSMVFQDNQDGNFANLRILSLRQNKLRNFPDLKKYIFSKSIEQSRFKELRIQNNLLICENEIPIHAESQAKKQSENQALIEKPVLNEIQKPVQNQKQKQEQEQINKKYEPSETQFDYTLLKSIENNKVNNPTLNSENFENNLLNENKVSSIVAQTRTIILQIENPAERENQMLLQNQKDKTENNQTQSKSKASVDQKKDVQVNQVLVETAEEKLERNVQNLEILFQRNVAFYFPIESTQFYQDKSYQERLIQIVSRLKNKNVKFLFFTQVPQIQEQNEDKANKEDNIYYNEKPQSKIKINYEVSKDTSTLNDTQFELIDSTNYLYFKKCYLNQDDTAIGYNLGHDNQFPQYYNFWHPRIPVNMKHFMAFDWKILCYLNLYRCQIDDDGWDEFTVNAKSQIPNVTKIQIGGNLIKTVNQIQLSRLSKQLKDIMFYSSYYPQQNPLSDDSILQIKAFNKQNAPQIGVVYDQDSQQQHEQNIRRR